jgi:hypothetical protein
MTDNYSDQLPGLFAGCTKFDLDSLLKSPAQLALQGIMRVAERGDWLAYAWICERTAPHLYALRSVSRVVEEDQQFEEPIPGEILAKHRQFYAEMLLEDQAKSQSRSAADSVEQINQTSGKQIGQL